MATIASSNDITPYAGSDMAKGKERRGTCRHFIQGRCVYWQTPWVCNFPHRPEHAPRHPLPVETAPPQHHLPPPYGEEATPFVPANPQHATGIAAHPLAQEPAFSPNSSDDRHGYHGDGSQYLGYHSNNTDPNGRVDFQPYHYLVPSPPGFPPAEPRLARADYYPGHGIYYHNPWAPFYYVPEDHAMPMAVGFSNSHPQAYQNQYQQPYQLPCAPPDSAPTSFPGLFSTTSCAPPLGSGYAAPPFAEMGENPLVNPEKLKRERSKVCWYGDECKRPNCYYRHGVVEDEVERESSASDSSSASFSAFSSASSSASSSTSAFAGSSAPDGGSINTDSGKGKEKWSSKRSQAPESSSDHESSNEVKAVVEDEPTAGDETSEAKPSDGRELSNSRRPPLVVNGTNYRRRPKDTAA